MKKNILFVLWGGMFILCAALGFIPQPEGSLRLLLRILAVAFFIPPAVLLFGARSSGDRDLLKLIRNLSGLSLLLSLVGLLLNILFAPGSETVGNILHSILIILSSPMICCGNWALSLFLWACLLMGSMSLLRKLPQSDSKK